MESARSARVDIAQLVACGGIALVTLPFLVELLGTSWQDYGDLGKGVAIFVGCAWLAMVAAMLSLAVDPD